MVRSKVKSHSSKFKSNLITYTNPGSNIAEQFRNIRTNIHFATSGKKNIKILFTSPCIGEGKSTNLANLAISLIQQKEKVLIIDANLRGPVLHTIFKVNNSSGLTNVLSGQTTFDEAVNHTGIGRLDILTSGPIPLNPAEELGSHMMSILLKNITPFYDYILIDSSSILEVTDANILANLCDGVILVLKRGKTQIEKALVTKRLLEFAKAHIVGVILNS